MASMSQAPAADAAWSWPDSLDACVAAPDSHRVILENETVRVLEVVIEPGVREPTHTHRSPSVMIVDEPARIRYYNADALTFESRAGQASVGHRVMWMAPEPPHSIENIDVHRYHAYRIEFNVAP